jgi:pimeloyl-ACP methyl ester carboxylesterase
MPKVKVNEIAIYYTKRGEGTPLIMINGWGSSSEGWYPEFIKELSKHHELILIDNRGTGQSDKPDNEYSIKTMARDTAKIMEALNISRAHVFGASMGGMIAQEFALHYPEKVESLILGSTAYGGSEMIWSEETRKLINDFSSDNPPEMTSELLQNFLILTLTPSYVKENINSIMQHLKSVKYPTPTYTRRRQAQAILNHDTFDRLSQIKAPTLVLFGEKDAMIPKENSKILAEKIPNTKLKKFENVGHNFTAGNEKNVAKVILEFLSL